MTGLGRWAFGLLGFIGIAALAALRPAAAEPPTQISEAFQKQGSGGGVVTSDGLPQVLSRRDADLYRATFVLQESGRWSDADLLIGGIFDLRLIGHVLAQRYLHPTDYRSSFEELRDWLKHYADHPQAQRIHRLALARRPAGAAAPPSPKPRDSNGGFGFRSNTLSRPVPARGPANDRLVRLIKRQVQKNLRNTRFTVTERLLAKDLSRQLLANWEIDELLGQVAAAWFHHGDTQRAFDLAARAAKRSGQMAPLANWTAGLAAWKMERYEPAAKHFERCGSSPYASSWDRAACAYWAARSLVRMRQPAEMSRWLVIAAGYARTFYGLLARRALGIETRFNFDAHPLTTARVAEIEAFPEGSRALALLQVGRRDEAEGELLRLTGLNDPHAMTSLLSLAEKGGMAALAFRVASRLADEDGIWPYGSLDAALYPLPPWQPLGGFKVDRALIYAVMRQESAFDTNARSPADARGLMQILPSTARYVARISDNNGHDKKLYDPISNLTLAQAYILHLLEQDQIEGDLFLLTAAYNGGPANLPRWRSNAGEEDDPLLFIESVTFRETRDYIERVLANFWIYRARLGQDAPSLEALASGGWPAYMPLDEQVQEVRRHGAN